MFHLFLTIFVFMGTDMFYIYIFLLKVKYLLPLDMSNNSYKQHNDAFTHPKHQEGHKTPIYYRPLQCHVTGRLEKGWLPSLGSGEKERRGRGGASGVIYIWGVCAQMTLHSLL